MRRRDQRHREFIVLGVMPAEGQGLAATACGIAALIQRVAEAADHDVAVLAWA